MTTGTEGPDVLHNDHDILNETIDALGGNDSIAVDDAGTSLGVIRVDGGRGFDTLTINGTLLVLSFTSTNLTSGAFSPVNGLVWTSVERLMVFGSALGGRGQDGSFLPTGWATGDTIDEIHVAGSFGQARFAISTGGGDDKIYLGDVGAGSRADGGPGNDLIDLGAFPAALAFANGDAGDDILIGSAQADNLNGGGGNDQLRSGAGNDILEGAAGNDILYFGAAFTGADRADGGDGRDVVVLQGDYAIAFGETQLAGLESISLQSGANLQFGDADGNFYDYAVTTADGNVAADQQMIVNGQSLREGENLTFDGSAESDGRFLVFGGHGVDILKGGSGNDLFVFDGVRWGAGDRVDGGGGRDAVVITAGNGLTHIDFGATSLVDVESVSVANRYASDPAAIPSYELVLHKGNVAAGATLIVNGHSLADPRQTFSVDGSAILDGRLKLFGGAGRDLLIGGGGADTLAGGAGGDVFRYNATSDSTASAPDRITDFEPGADKIDLTRIDAVALAAGDEAFTWIGPGTFNGVAGELRVFQSGGDWIVEGDADGDGVADLVIIVTSPGGAPLGQGDFLL